jgi:hypothetical protein
MSLRAERLMYAINFRKIRITKCLNSEAKRPEFLNAKPSM